jgi:hypothetical protein
VKSSNRVAVAALAVTTAVTGVAGYYAATSQAASRIRVMRAFSVDSFWNAPLPANAPQHPSEAAILQYMSSGAEADGGCIRLAGTGHSSWGQPVFFAKRGDRSYDVRLTSMSKRPPEFRHLRIPARARAAANSDATMTLFDKGRGYVVAFTGAHYSAGRWSARGATITYLRSNGLNVKTGRADDHRNRGSHRGNNGATMMVRYREIRAGHIRHVLKVSSGPEAHAGFYFPMVNSDGNSTNPAAPKQGTRFRIKPSVDIAALHLPRQARIIARALQRYGMYIGDSSSHTTLKLEDTRAEGHGQKWRISSSALCSLPLGSKYWDVVKGGYDPSR